jgi:hypothetical protein
MNNIVPSKAPNLTVAPATYDRRYFDQLTSQLRLYFNQVDNANGQLIQASYSNSVMEWLGEGSF